MIIRNSKHIKTAIIKELKYIQNEYIHQYKRKKTQQSQLTNNFFMSYKKSEQLLYINTHMMCKKDTPCTTSDRKTGRGQQGRTE